MQFSKTLISILSNIIFISAVAQQQQGYAVQYDNFRQISNLDKAISTTLIDEVTIYGGNNKIEYSRVTGSRFWNDEWQKAALYINDKVLGIIPARLNLVNSELHVILNDKEQAITNDISSVIFFKESDTSVSSYTFIRHVPHLMLNNKKLDDFVQVLNYGNYQLLKYTNRYVTEGDSLFHTLKRYYFSDKIYYFIKSSAMVEKIPKLTKENVLAHLPSSSAFTGWIKENNIDFKKEADVIRFLDYYNANKPQ